MTPSAMRARLAPRPTRPDTAEASLVAAAQKYLEALSDGRCPTPTMTNSWLRFYHQYSPLVRRYAHACGSPEAELDDAVQEVWVLLLDHLRDFDPASTGARFETWLYALVHNRLANMARYRSRHRAQSLDAIRAAGLIESRDSPPQCQRNGSIRAVWEETVTQMPQRDQKVLYLRYVKNREIFEIAGSLGVARSRVWAWHLRAKRRLRRLIGGAAAAGRSIGLECFGCEHFRECADGILASCCDWR